MSNFRCCNPHTLKLREAIEERRMGHLIRHNAEEAAAIAARLQVGQGRGNQDFDPFIQAQLMVAQKAGESMNPKWMVDALPDGTCPLCMVRDVNTITEASWIKGVANELLEEAWARGLMSKTALLRE